MPIGPPDWPKLKPPMSKTPHPQAQASAWVLTAERSRAPRPARMTDFFIGNLECQDHAAKRRSGAREGCAAYSRKMRERIRP